MTGLLCKIIGHNYVKVRIEGSPDGYFLRCLRCRKERDQGSRIAAIGIQ